MSSEQNMPEVPTHQGPPPPQQGESFNGSSSPHGMGQSKSSRRRRRKRKSKGDDGEGEGQPQAAATPSTLPSLQAQAAPTQASQNGGAAVGPNGQQHQQNSTGKRWKKKFRDRERPRFSDNPGNQATGSGFASNGPSTPRDTNTHQFGNRADGFKRKGSSGGGKQQRERGPRSFVGPMDHSYRSVTGGFDTPPSTIEPRGGNGSWARSYQGGDSQPIDYSQGRPVPIPEDAPTRIFFFIDDLFFLAKISETARKLGVKVSFLKNEKESVAGLLALEEDKRPGLIVFDLNNANAKPMTLIPKIKAKFKRQTSVVGFLSHIQGDLKAKATEAGCDTVMPRAAFSQNLPNLLRRYGIEEEHDEGNFNQ